MLKSSITVRDGVALSRLPINQRRRKNNFALDNLETVEKILYYKN